MMMSGPWPAAARGAMHFGHGVGAFERGDDAFQPREFHERLERLVVGGVGVFDAFLVAQPGVLGADGGVVQSGARRCG